jgi:hypothetical protein
MMQLQESVNSMMQNQQQMMERMMSKMAEIQTEIAVFNTWKQSVDSRSGPFTPGGPMTGPSRPTPVAHHWNSVSDQSGSRMPTPVQGRAHSSRMNSMQTDTALAMHPGRSPLATHSSTPIKEEFIMSQEQLPATPAGEPYSDLYADRLIVEFDKHKTGLQADHTTPAHRVLQDWNSMATFLEGMEFFDNLKAQGLEVGDYPWKIEQERGLIRVWGVGEGSEVNVAAAAPSPFSPSSNDSDTPSPQAESQSLWGKLEVSSPSTLGAVTPQEGDTVGGLGPDGRLKLDKETLMRLFKSYLNNIHILQPFLNPAELKKMVKSFSLDYGPEASNKGIKRKRSGTGFDEAQYATKDNISADAIHKSISNAIVLLVLALGKVSEWKKPLPAPDSEGWADASSRSATNSFSSDSGTESRRNIDILPGMAYYAVATDILGNQCAGNTIMHAQAMLLAGLYMGQYARVHESWSWIHTACRMCLVVIKSEMPNIGKIQLFSKNKEQKKEKQKSMSEKEKYRLDLMKFVYWACLQLESDILAELSTLPVSEISKYQDEISYPEGVFENAYDHDPAMYSESTHSQKTMILYSGQIHLRVVLNQAHNTLYNRKRKKDFQNQRESEVADLAKVAKAAGTHRDMLKSWRMILLEELRWNDDDPPSTDLNIARLRAKFYGGQYMILRPFLFMAIHSEPKFHPEHPNRLIDDHEGLLAVTAECIDSAIQSTIAFDRVGCDPDSSYKKYEDIPEDRLIVTNIFGTLHAYVLTVSFLLCSFSNLSQTIWQHDRPCSSSPF